MSVTSHNVKMYIFLRPNEKVAPAKPCMSKLDHFHVTDENVSRLSPVNDPYFGLLQENILGVLDVCRTADMIEKEPL